MSGVDRGVLDRAQGCWLGQLAGDSLGSLVEFRRAADIAAQYPDGVRDLADGGTWGTIAGQPTDDSEMALALARSLVARGTYDHADVLAAYQAWAASDPFDIGNTTRAGLAGYHAPESQANGALMRISPLGIFGARRDPVEVRAWARADARQTHIHEVCQAANEVFVTALVTAIGQGAGAAEVLAVFAQAAADPALPEAVRACLAAAADAPPADYQTHQGWVCIALGNAVWQLGHAPSLEEGIIDTVGRGGDTDTNAAIAGALLGAVHGRAAVPRRWEAALVACRPEAGRPGVQQPRPAEYWPNDCLELAAALVGGAD